MIDKVRQILSKEEAWKENKSFLCNIKELAGVPVEETVQELFKIAMGRELTVYL